MTKKIYKKPEMKVVELRHKSRILVSSLESVNTWGLDDNELEYDNQGADQASAW